MADYDKLLQVPRGTKARLEEIKLDLLENTLVYATDTKELGVKLSNGNIEYFMNATDINAKIDVNTLGYMNHASSIYRDKYSLLANAWEHSLTVDPLEISADNSIESSTTRGTAQYPNGETEGVIIPQGVTTIGNRAFRNWTSNNQPLVIPESVTSIGEFAFDGWSSNNYPLVIPSSVTSIGGAAFRAWSSNSHPLVIPESVTSIGSDAFSDWSSNNYPLVISESVTSIGDGAFYNWTENKQPLVIPNNITSIENKVFERWSSNNHPLVIPNSVTSIGDWAFSYWSSNNQPLVIPESVTSIGSSAFYNWTGNKQPLVIPNSVTNIDGGAFYNWTSNNQPLVIPESVTSIGSSAFSEWHLVPYVEIQATTPPTLVNANAFYYQNNAPIYVPDESVEAYRVATIWVDLADRIFSINDKPIIDEPIIDEPIVDEVDFDVMIYLNYASNIYGDKYNLFANAWKHSLTVDPSEISAVSGYASPKGIPQYPNGATEGVIIPQGVTYIGQYAFYGWSSNNQPLVIPNSVISVGESAFYGWTSNNQPLIIPSSVKSISNGAFQGWSSNTHPLVIPSGVTHISNGAFYNWLLVPYVEIHATTPPTLGGVTAFLYQNNAPIYVPDESVEAYRVATIWVDLADRIFPISDKPDSSSELEATNVSIWRFD